jgi:hypothetical protein
MSSRSKKGTQIPGILSFSLKKSQQANPLQVPQRGPYGQTFLCLSWYITFYLSLRVPGNVAPSLFLNRVDVDRYNPSPEPLVYLFIHSCILPEYPKKEPSYKMGKNIRSPSTEPHADGRPTYNGVQRGSPTGSLTTLLSLPQCRAALVTIPSTLAWVDQSPISQRDSWQPPSHYTFHNCYRIPRDPG